MIAGLSLNNGNFPTQTIILKPSKIMISGGFLSSGRSFLRFTSLSAGLKFLSQSLTWTPRILAKDSYSDGLNKLKEYGLFNFFKTN